MREHSVNKLDNFICGWYMDDTSLCDELIEYYKRIEEAKDHCLWFAFNQSKIFSQDELDSLKLLLVQGNFPKSGLEELGKKFNIQINLTEYLNTSGLIKNYYKTHLFVALTKL